MKTTNLFVITAAAAMLAACQSEPPTNPNPDPRGPATTNMSVHLLLPGKTKAGRGVRIYNDGDKFGGAQEIVSLDVYITSDDRKTMLFAQRFTKAAGQVVYESGKNGANDMVSLKDPIKTTAGSRWFFLVVNNATGLPLSTPPDQQWTFNSALTSLDRIAKVDISYPSGPVNNAIFPGETLPFDIYPDIITMSGAPAGSINIEDGVTQQDALTGVKNSFTVQATRLASRVIVTKTAAADPVDVIDGDGVKLGTVSNITWSVAQGCRDVYLFPNTVSGTNDTQTPAYSYVPGTDYSVQASALFSYNDLTNTTDAVPTLPDKKYLMYMPGKFLLENTHASGVDATTSSYKQGNTAYVLVRTKFTPVKFTDAGTPPTDGTFYVGESDYKVYTSVSAAQDANNGGTANQGVFKYDKGKVLYIVWLNPDIIDRPINSPVERNNIYHINIKGFKQIGINWNPLVPAPSPGTTPNNPDPKPGDNDQEPDLPLDPQYPLSPKDTYIDVNAEILPWFTHSYETEL